MKLTDERKKIIIKDVARQINNTMFFEKPDEEIADMEELTELFAKAFGHFELLGAVVTLASAAREVLSILQTETAVPKVMQDNLERALKSIGWA